MSAMSRLPVRSVLSILLALCAWLAAAGAAADPRQTSNDARQPVSGVRGSGGGAGPVTVTVTETVTVTDAAKALPPVAITIHESVGITDRPGGAPPARPDAPAKNP
jgi:hypothetical protein